MTFCNHWYYKSELTPLRPFLPPPPRSSESRRPPRRVLVPRLSFLFSGGVLIFEAIVNSFFVAFLSWFAFLPFISDAIKSNLHLSSTLLARVALHHDSRQRQGTSYSCDIFRILISPLTWLPSLAYMATFGLELAIDGNLGIVKLKLDITRQYCKPAIFLRVNLWGGPAYIAFLLWLSQYRDAVFKIT